MVKRGRPRRAAPTNSLLWFQSDRGARFVGDPEVNFMDHNWSRRRERHIVENRDARLTSRIKETRGAPRIHSTEVKFVGRLDRAGDGIGSGRILNDPLFSGDLTTSVSRPNVVEDSPSSSMGANEMNRHQGSKTRRSQGQLLRS